MDIEPVIRHGDPCKELLKRAQDERADQIIIGGLNGVGHRLTGGLALRLQRHSATAITVVP